MFEPRFLHVYRDGGFDDTAKSRLEHILDEQQVETAFEVVKTPECGLFVMFDLTNMSFGAQHELQSTVRRCVQNAFGETNYDCKWLQ